jgi:Fur family transcriptional regulator, iron response regulator
MGIVMDMSAQQGLVLPVNDFIDARIERRQLPNDELVEKLRAAELRPTRQRIELARLLLNGVDRHTTAEALHVEAVQAGIAVSIATIYNTLHQFTEAGLLRQVVVDGSKTYFDTNVSDHHHFYIEEDGLLFDIPPGCVHVEDLPRAPEGTEVSRVDVIVRLRRAPARRR